MAERRAGAFHTIRYFGATGRVERVLRVFGTRDHCRELAHAYRRGSSLWLMERSKTPERSGR